MFESVANSIKKFLPKEQGPLYFLIIVVLLAALYFYSGSKTNVFDSMHTGAYGATDSTMPTGPTAPSTGPTMPTAPSPSAQTGGYALQPVANPQDLLPKDMNSQWSALNPAAMNQGDILMPDLLQAGYHIGLDTIGQTLRNPNLQLRSDPIITKADVGPWNHSTIEPDYARVPLELGAK